MASAAQVAANRSNCLGSTGSKSPPGKRVSSRNAVTHGLSGSATAALMASEEGRDLLEARKAQWRPEFDPRGEVEESLFERVVAESIRVDRCGDAYSALCRAHGRRASSEWDADRRRQADELAARLAREPHAVARRLEATRQGVELMLDLWRGLAASLERHATWTDAQRSLALDLLGVRPEFRDAETPVDPAGGDALEIRRGVIAAEIARLEALRDGALADLDASDRALAEATVGAELTRPLQLLHRYEMAAQRRQQAAWRKLDAARADRAPAAAPKPAPPPAPRPPPRPPPARAGPRAAADDPARPGAGADPAVAPAQPPPAPRPGRRRTPGRSLTGADRTALARVFRPPTARPPTRRDRQDGRLAPFPIRDRR